jgi:hypothetical protein
MRTHRTPLVGLAAAGLLALAIAAPAAAGSGRVAITLDADFGTGVETFTATGAFCPAGTAETPGIFFAGRGRASTFHLFKVLTCANGLDTLTIRVDAATIAGASGDQGGWSVVEGTGAYAGAGGGGRLVGTYYDNGGGDLGVIDRYTGVINR